MPHYIVIGGGIVGSSIALELCRRGAGQVTLLEKESAVGRHASGRNSGVIHSGINQKPGSLKARMCLEGSRLLREYCLKNNVPMFECGTLVVARHEKEEQVLEKLLAWGRECGVPGLSIIGRAELKQREPSAEGIAALFSPTGAVVDSHAFIKAIASTAQKAGVRYRFVHKVLGIDKTKIRTTEGDFQADYIVNCAGLYADEIAHMMGVGLQYRVIPFRGEYMEVKNCDVRSMIYQPPDLRYPFLSIHLTRETDGRVLAGPSAVMSFGRESYDKEWDFSETMRMMTSRQFWRMVLKPSFLRVAFENARTSLSKRAFYEQIRSLVPSVKLEDLSPARAGIRAQMVDSKGNMVEDILVEHREYSTHILNAVSPGMTCSLAFSQSVVNKILK